MKPDEVSRVAFSGLIWASSGTAILTLGRFLSLVVLSRSLTPTDFGVISIAMAVVAAVGLLAELGLGSALVQKSSIEQWDFRNALFIGGAGAVTSVIVLWMTSSEVARFFDNSEVASVIQICALTILCRALAIPSEAMLQRE